jgi:hypothetical protein
MATLRDMAIDCLNRGVRPPQRRHNKAARSAGGKAGEGEPVARCRQR